MDLEALHNQYLDRAGERSSPLMWSQNAVDQGCVVSAHYLASAAGAKILADGGNAIDAALATSFALGVCEPAASGIGGMATMVIYRADNQQLFTIEGPCRAPFAATPEKLASANRYRGYAAIAIPGNIKALHRAHKTMGKLGIAAILEPAIQIATDGFRVTSTFSSLQHQYIGALTKQTAGLYYLDENKPHELGAVIRQPVLANTLSRLAEHGLQDFYEGGIANEIASDSAANGGFITAADLLEMPDATVKESVSGPFGDMVIHTVGPPAGGMALVQLAQLVDASGRQSFDLDNANDVLILAELFKLVRSQRRDFNMKYGSESMGNAGVLISPEYNTRLYQKRSGEFSSSGETSHISVVDRWGNALALTQSIERSFGSAIVSPGLGFCYNGYLRAFKIESRNHPHFLRPMVAARSNASPSLLTKNGKPHIVIGSTGSERMASGIMTTLLALRTKSTFEAIHQQRLHCTPENLLMLEADRFASSAIESLEQSEYQIERTGSYSFKMGGQSLITIDENGICGAADPRRDGAAICG